ncbi:MAG: tripartite tricarboxylate transporter substrate binding protein [Xanthobacteraceae bacterium]|nr:tripartite tricarboxylate transporter substrate binding protein [Xanthobacteraceae bacterium]
MAQKAWRSRRAWLQGASALTMSAPFIRTSSAAGYPDRPVRIVVPFAPGGPSDITARFMSVKLGEALGHTFMVENRAGAGSNLGTLAVARSAPDGYTLLVTSSAFTVNPSLYKQVPYDPFKDFAPVAELDTSPNVFVATLTSGITSIKDVVARAKATPDELSYASAGVGTTPHLATELLKITAGINVTHVPYQGNGPAMQSILAGTVPLMCGSLPGAHGSIKNGQLRALAVTGPTRWYDMPDVPAMIELGYADFIVDTFHCMLAPAGTPREIVERLAAACVATLKEPTVHEKLRSMGFETIANGPDGLARRIAGDVQRYRDIIAKAGIERV